MHKITRVRVCFVFQRLFRLVYRRRGSLLGEAHLLALAQC